MSRGIVTFFFLMLNIMFFSTLVFPPFFKYINRIEPLVLGLPFVQFWILLVIFLVSVSLIIWYIVEDKRGDLE